MKLPTWLQRFVVIDVETTGLDPAQDRITEIGVALYVDGKLEQRKGFFVNPEGRGISPRVQEITGITSEMLLGAPPFWHVYNELAPLLYLATPVAYNRSFDRRFLASAVLRAWPRAAFGLLPPVLDPNVEWVDPWPFARLGLRDEAKAAQGTSYPSFKLVKVAELLGLPIDEAHRADFDALLTGAVLLELYRRFADHADWNLEAACERMLYVDYLRALHNFHKKGKRVPEGARFQAFQCDVCREVKSGTLLDSPINGSHWTLPPEWFRVGTRMVCSSVCDTIERWSR